MSAATKLGVFVAELKLAVVPEDVVEKARCALLHNLSVAAAAGILAPVGTQLTLTIGRDRDRTRKE